MTIPPLVDIITIGTELILGRIADTNAAYLAGRIAGAGVRIRRITTIRDDPKEIVAVIRDSIGQGATHILTTGGLGPTPDDLTVETVAGMIGCGVVVDQGLMGHFRMKLGLAEGETISPAMRKVATIPEQASAHPNLSGWGHCITVEHGGALLFILPGPPREVQALYPVYIEPVFRALSPV